MSTAQPTRLMTRSRRSWVCRSDQTSTAEPAQPSASSHHEPMGDPSGVEARGGLVGDEWPTTLSPITAPTMPASSTTLTTENSSSPKVIA